MVGLSGGIDSSVVTFLCARALGPENVLAVTMPYKTSSEATRRDSQAVIDQLGVRTVDVPITDQIDAYFARFPDASQLRLANKCARERMTVLYDQSAAFEALVAGTSNKSELLLGLRHAVRRHGLGHQSHRRSLQDATLPPGRPPGRARARFSRKEPTGDLWVGQTDEGELGFSYAEVDRLLVLLVDRRWRRAELLQAGFAAEFVDRVATHDPPQPLQAPHAGDRQALAPHDGPRLPLRPRLGNVASRPLSLRERVRVRACYGAVKATLASDRQECLSSCSRCLLSRVQPRHQIAHNLFPLRLAEQFVVEAGVKPQGLVGRSRPGGQQPAALTIGDEIPRAVEDQKRQLQFSHARLNAFCRPEDFRAVRTGKRPWNTSGSFRKASTTAGSREMYRQPMRTTRSVGQTTTGKPRQMPEHGKHAAADHHGRAAENQPANLWRPQDSQQGDDRPAHAVAQQEQRLAGLPGGDPL